MTLRNCQLLLYLLVVDALIWLCVANQYYVKPSENYTCPGQPCLTLSQYIRESDIYFHSNVVFKFMPGSYYLNRSLDIVNVHNLSLVSISKESIQLVRTVSPTSIQYYCLGYYIIYISLEVIDFACPTALWVYNSYNITLKGINIIVMPGILGIALSTGP